MNKALQELRSYNGGIMKSLFYGSVLAAMLMASAVSAQETTYTFTGGTYTNFENAIPGGCTVGECATYTTEKRIVATVTFSAPLAPNLPMSDRSAQIVRYSFTDGVRSTVGPSYIASLDGIEIATNGAGNVTNFYIGMQRTPGLPYAVNTPTDPNSRFSYVILNPTSSYTYGNTISPERGPRVGAAVSGPGHSINALRDNGYSGAHSVGPTVVTVTTVAPPIPTMTEWAMIFLGLTLVGGATVIIQRRRFAG